STQLQQRGSSTWRTAKPFHRCFNSLRSKTLAHPVFQNPDGPQSAEPGGPPNPSTTASRSLTILLIRAACASALARACRKSCSTNHDTRQSQPLVTHTHVSVHG